MSDDTKLNLSSQMHSTRNDESAPSPQPRPTERESSVASEFYSAADEADAYGSVGSATNRALHPGGRGAHSGIPPTASVSLGDETTAPSSNASDASTWNTPSLMAAAASPPLLTSDGASAADDDGGVCSSATPPSREGDPLSFHRVSGTTATSSPQSTTPHGDGSRPTEHASIHPHERQNEGAPTGFLPQQHPPHTNTSSRRGVNYRSGSNMAMDKGASLRGLVGERFAHEKEFLHRRNSSTNKTTAAAFTGVGVNSDENPLPPNRQDDSSDHSLTSLHMMNVEDLFNMTTIPYAYHNGDLENRFVQYEFLRCKGRYIVLLSVVLVASVGSALYAWSDQAATAASVLIAVLLVIECGLALLVVVRKARRVDILRKRVEDHRQDVLRREQKKWDQREGAQGDTRDRSPRGHHHQHQHGRGTNTNESEGRTSAIAASCAAAAASAREFEFLVPPDDSITNCADLETPAKVHEIVCTLGYLTLVLTTILTAYEQSSSCTWILAYDDRQEGERCPFHLFPPVFFFSQLPLLVGQPRFTMTVVCNVILGLAFVSTLRLHDTSSFTEIVLVACIAESFLMFATFLKLISERHNRRLFESQLIVEWQTYEIYAQSEVLKQFVLSITPTYLRSRLTNPATITEVDVSEEAVVLQLEIRNSIEFMQRNVPGKSARALGLFRHHVIHDCPRYDFHHIRDVGDTGYFVANLFKSDTPDLASAASNGVRFAHHVHTNGQHISLSVAVGIGNGDLIGMPVGLCCARYDLVGTAMATAQAFTMLCPTTNTRVSTDVYNAVAATVDVLPDEEVEQDVYNSKVIVNVRKHPVARNEQQAQGNLSFEESEEVPTSAQAININTNNNNHIASGGGPQGEEVSSAPYPLNEEEEAMLNENAAGLTRTHVSKQAIFSDVVTNDCEELGDSTLTRAGETEGGNGVAPLLSFKTSCCWLLEEFVYEKDRLQATLMEQRSFVWMMHAFSVFAVVFLGLVLCSIWINNKGKGRGGETLSTDTSTACYILMGASIAGYLVCAIGSCILNTDCTSGEADDDHNDSRELKVGGLEHVVSVTTVDSQEVKADDDDDYHYASKIHPWQQVVCSISAVSALVAALISKPSLAGDDVGYLVFFFLLGTLVLGLGRWTKVCAQLFLIIWYVAAQVSHKPLLTASHVPIFVVSLVMLYCGMVDHREQLLLYATVAKRQRKIVELEEHANMRNAVHDAVIPRQLRPLVNEKTVLLETLKTWSTDDCVVITVNLSQDLARVPLHPPAAAGAPSSSSAPLGPHSSVSGTEQSVELSMCVDSSLAANLAQFVGSTATSESRGEMPSSTTQGMMIPAVTGGTFTSSTTDDLGSDHSHGDGRGSLNPLIPPVLQPSREEDEDVEISVDTTVSPGATVAINRNNSHHHRHHAPPNPKEVKSKIDAMLGIVESAVSTCTHSSMDIVKSFGGTIIIAGPLRMNEKKFESVDDGLHAHHRHHKQKHSNEATAEEAASTQLLHAVSDAFEILETMMCHGLHFTAGVTFEQIVHIIRLTKLPSYDCVGPAVNCSKLMAAACPAEGMVAATDKITKLFLRECPPRPNLTVGGSESWRLRDLGNLRVRMIKLSSQGLSKASGTPGSHLQPEAIAGNHPRAGSTSSHFDQQAL